MFSCALLIRSLNQDVRSIIPTVVSDPNKTPEFASADPPPHERRHPNDAYRLPPLFSTFPALYRPGFSVHAAQTTNPTICVCRSLR